jgi:hypothetical protein
VASARHDTRLACADVDIEEHRGSGGGGHTAFARDAEPVRPLLLVEIRAVDDHAAPLREGQLCFLLAYAPVAQLVLAHNHPVSLAKLVGHKRLSRTRDADKHDHPDGACVRGQQGILYDTRVLNTSPSLT